MNCIDVAPDPVWIGKDNLITCVSPQRCHLAGCYWRSFHQLRQGQFARPRVAALAGGPGDDGDDEDDDEAAA